MFKSPVAVNSPAKINLILKVTGRRSDGYHNIATLFQMIDLCDRITFYPASDGKIKVTCSDSSIPQKRNLAYLAAMELWKPGMPGVRIHIEKKIPVGAGLGGGSSNAAAVLSVLNRLWKLGLSDKALRAKGEKLGADVPFFLFAPRAWATGIGDRLTRLPAQNRFWVVVVKPRVKISTDKIYKLFDKRLKNRPKLVKISPQLKGSATLEATVQLMSNDLEKVVSGEYPVIGKIKRMLENLGSKGVMLAGSGSAVFAIFGNSKEANSAFHKISVGPWYCAVAVTVNSMRHLELAKGEKKWK